MLPEPLAELGPRLPASHPELPSAGQAAPWTCGTALLPSAASTAVVRAAGSPALGPHVPPPPSSRSWDRRRLTVPSSAILKTKINAAD